MSISIVTDSTCDLPEGILTTYGITVIPLYINIGSQSYLDGVELSHAEFYRQLPHYTPYPTTAAPGPGHFQRVYEQLATAGATEILSIHLTHILSATIQHASLAAQETKSVSVTVFDSQQLSVGLGFLVETAAQAAQAGDSLSQILALLRTQISRIYLFAVLDTLEYVKRSGRINWAVADLGSLLRINPILALHQGKASLEKVRTHKRAINHLVERVREIAPLEKVTLLHSHAPTKAVALREELVDTLSNPRPDIIEITPIIGTHVGPGAVGVACLRAEQ